MSLLSSAAKVRQLCVSSITEAPMWRVVFCIHIRYVTVHFQILSLSSWNKRRTYHWSQTPPQCQHCGCVTWQMSGCWLGPRRWKLSRWESPQCCEANLWCISEFCKDREQISLCPSLINLKVFIAQEHKETISFYTSCSQSPLTNDLCLLKPRQHFKTIHGRCSTDRTQGFF